MYYYKHHIGDFIKDTSFLTNEEVAIYLKLLWIYYDTERPLPNDIGELTRKSNARKSRSIIETILSTFFVFSDQDNCWIHERCENEIALFRQQLATASKAGKASAAKRTINYRSTPVEQPFNQPLTINQEPLTIKEKSKATASRLSPDWKPSFEDLDFCRTHRPDLDGLSVAGGFIDYWTSVPGAKGRKLDWSATWRNWVRNQRQVQQQKIDEGKRMYEILTGSKPNESLERIERTVTGEVITDTNPFRIASRVDRESV